ncbi:hypothetical protein B0G75_13227 [Paraburkholderia sp. BL18I3N2]|nr:hypothetical protein B0G75_13227 [Paraburkholderia sp. BL18I3N2]
MSFHAEVCAYGRLPGFNRYSRYREIYGRSPVAACDAKNRRSIRYPYHFTCACYWREPAMSALAWLGGDDTSAVLISPRLLPKLRLSARNHDLRAPPQGGPALAANPFAACPRRHVLLERVEVPWRPLHTVVTGNGRLTQVPDRSRLIGWGCWRETTGQAHGRRPEAGKGYAAECQSSTVVLSDVTRRIGRQTRRRGRRVVMAGSSYRFSHCIVSYHA